MDAGLFLELKERYPEDIKDVSSEMAMERLLINPTASPMKEKDGEFSATLYPMLKEFRLRMHVFSASAL
ncbi:Hypothetical predicted protein [Octopus vulgaris]|uniref:Uncharacterized protein n=1 Tax=Octopus vulgaris TaxID=6645 RepID=A0AA36AZP4_OCTVU|nr:Hypothetical predicted protein [Octopus vulgaris]